MLNVLRSIPDLATLPGPIYLAIGVFDGVHLGHRSVLLRALTDARNGAGTAVAVTFDPHPIKILRPENAPRLLTASGHKLSLIRELGVQSVLVIPFTKEFAATPPEDFVRQLHAAGQPLKEICVGHEWSFGKGRAGNLDMLGRMGDCLGFDEVGVPAVQVDGEIVSSTAIRAAVENGDLPRAARLLGREYSILGTVTRGERLGHQLGFPTANLSAHNEQFPPNGVYAVTAQWNGRPLKGVVNLGIRPTIASATGERILELHLFDFDQQIYGEDIEVTFRAYLRPEKRFDNLDALKSQIGHDAAEARRALS
ncbi:MAG TPA: bifunctional riboflavin kinase/FAD synthetase [Chthoniobacteraceae bacterium]|jgi:riboflavin kinase/FMN adenylyltransferase|nr:bifunctional riboflavin kinase/FAD synthetase [Chthoniobacteraceae bacterium]